MGFHVNGVDVAAVHFSAKRRCLAGAPRTPVSSPAGPVHEWEMQETEHNTSCANGKQQWFSSRSDEGPGSMWVNEGRVLLQRGYWRDRDCDSLQESIGWLWGGVDWHLVLPTMLTRAASAVTGHREGEKKENGVDARRRSDQSFFLYSFCFWFLSLSFYDLFLLHFTASVFLTVHLQGQTSVRRISFCVKQEHLLC